MKTRKCEPELDDDSIINFMVKVFVNFLFMIHALIPRSFNRTHYFSLIYKFSRREILDQKYRFPFCFEINCVSKKRAPILMHLNKPNFFRSKKIPERKNRNFYDKYAHFGRFFHDKYAHFGRQIIPPIENQLQNGQNKILCFPNQNCKFNFML